MKIKLDGIVSPELKEYLLTQEGITDVNIDYEGFFVQLNIKFTSKTTPIIIMKYIELFQKSTYSDLVEFDKEYSGKTKTLKYIIDDMCCEQCYMGLVMDLFENDKIKAVKSNFDFNNPAFNVEFKIEYDENYSEQDLIDYIKSKYK